MAVRINTDYYSSHCEPAIDLHTDKPHPKLSELVPEDVDVKIALGALEIRLKSSHPPVATTELQQSLYFLLTHTPKSWNWLLNLAPLRSYELGFLNILLAIGARLREQGGYLILEGIFPSAMPDGFFELFQSRCREECIELIPAPERTGACGH